MKEAKHGSSALWKEDPAWRQAIWVPPPVFAQEKGVK